MFSGMSETLLFGASTSLTFSVSNYRQKSRIKVGLANGEGTHEPAQDLPFLFFIFWAPPVVYWYLPNLPKFGLE